MGDETTFMNSRKKRTTPKQHPTSVTKSSVKRRNNENKEFLGQNQPCAVGQTAHIILEIPVKTLECHVFPKKGLRGRL